MYRVAIFTTEYEQSCRIYVYIDIVYQNAEYDNIRCQILNIEIYIYNCI